MAAEYIYVMKDLRKIVPPKREILKGIWLSFYPGAKIGVVVAMSRLIYWRDWSQCRVMMISTTMMDVRS